MSIIVGVVAFTLGYTLAWWEIDRHHQRMVDKIRKDYL